MQKRYEIGCYNRVKYALCFDQYKNQQACDYSIENKWAWFLTIDGEYIGNFLTKAEALKELGIRLAV